VFVDKLIDCMVRYTARVCARREPSFANTEKHAPERHHTQISESLEDLTCRECKTSSRLDCRPQELAEICPFDPALTFPAVLRRSHLHLRLSVNQSTYSVHSPIPIWLIEYEQAL
jgi:hypothetical protein